MTKKKEIPERELLGDLMKRLIRKMGNMGDITGYYSVVISQTNKVKEIRALDEPNRIWENHQEARVAVVFIDRPPLKGQMTVDQFITSPQVPKSINRGTNNISQSARILKDDYTQ